MTVKDKITMGMVIVGMVGLTIGGVLAVVYGITVVVKWAWEG